MAKINVDFTKTIGKIKPMHGVGQPPSLGMNFSMFRYLKDAHIPFSRLHDVGGFMAANRFADLPNLFRDFDADPFDPESYDFAFTDEMIKALVENGVEPFIRLGVSIENDIHIKAYRVFPPKDNLKWAQICEGVIRHYTEGWANGFHYNIRYWEIWNEPDNYENPKENQMWIGTKEQFYELYGVASKYLKERFPHLMIGGYASCGFYALNGEGVRAANSSPRYEYFIDFFDGFMDYIIENKCPMDFFSWHSYASIESTMLHAEYARKRLDEAGYSHVEHTCNEWNCRCDLKGSSTHAAYTAGMIMAMQNSSLDSAMFYDARCGTSVYGGMFNPMTHKPLPAYYAFYGFGQLYALGNQVALECDDKKVHAVAATGDDGAYIMIANTNEHEISIDLSTLGKEIGECRVVDSKNTFEVCTLPEKMEALSVLFIDLK